MPSVLEICDQSPMAMIWWSMHMTPILLPQKWTLVCWEDELQHIDQWATDSNLRLNPSKCSKLCFMPEYANVPKTNRLHLYPEFKFLVLLSVISCQWLDTFLHCWTSVQEHYVLRVLWTMSSPRLPGQSVFSARYWQSCCTQVLHGQASVLQQTSANLTGSFNRCRKLYRCRQLNKDISELYSLGDQCLFFICVKRTINTSFTTFFQLNQPSLNNLRPRRQFFFFSKTIQLW